MSDNLNDFFEKYKGEGCSFVTASFPQKTQNKKGWLNYVINFLRKM